jgi:hypothetical protein
LGNITPAHNVMTRRRFARIDEGGVIECVEHSASMVYAYSQARSAELRNMEVPRGWVEIRNGCRRQFRGVQRFGHCNLSREGTESRWWHFRAREVRRGSAECAQAGGHWHLDH